jgi:hypothetical protein
MAQPVQMPHHLPRAAIRALQERLVDQSHHLQRRLAFADRSVIMARPADLQQRTLPND